MASPCIMNKLWMYQHVCAGRRDPLTGEADAHLPCKHDAQSVHLCLSSASHAFAVQAAPELHIGLRTGYCGSLTTFASWEYSLVTGLIGGESPAAYREVYQGNRASA